MKLLAEGREAEVFAYGDGAVLKLFRDPMDMPRVETEAAALRALERNEYPAPRVLDVVTVDGRPGLVLERIDGRDLLTALGRNPFGLVSAGRSMAEAHSAMHGIVAPPELPDLHHLLRVRIEAAAPLPPDLRGRALALLDELPRGDRLCHGDLHPGNMLGTWSAPLVIDWGDAARGDPVADVARADLLVRLGVPPPGAPAIVRALASVVQRGIANRYLAQYRRRRTLDRTALERWRVVRAAARLFEPVPEHPVLLELVRNGLTAAASP